MPSVPGQKPRGFGWKKQITRARPPGAPRVWEQLNLKSPFKSPDGRWRTKSLFAETRTSDTDQPPVFTLGYGDRVDPVWGTLPSFRRHYLELEDPTGYKAAYELLGSYAHWRRLNTCPWFRELVADCNAEIAERLRWRLVERMRERASNGDFRAADWLIARKWETPAPQPTGPERTEKPGRGRPSNEQIKAETTRLATEQLEHMSDAQRIGLVNESRTEAAPKP